MRSMTSELRIAARSYLRTPSMTVAAVFTMGLAVAASTAVFTIFDGLLFRPLPFHQGDRIVHVAVSPNTARSLPQEQVRRLNELRANTPLLESRALAESAVLFDEGAEATVVWGLRPARISLSLFPLLGVQPAVGRGFTPEDANASREFSSLRVEGQGWELWHREAAGDRVGPAVVILGHDLWSQMFGADRSLIGQQIEIGGGLLPWRPVLVGVMPQGFSFPDGANVWVPASVRSPQFNYARLAGGASIQQVRSVLPGHEVIPLREHVRPASARATAVLMSGVALLLIVAWVQIGALLFARTTKRVSEIGIRLALGASRRRLVGDFAIEAGLLSLGALGVGAALVHPVTSTLVWLLPEEMTRGQHLGPDARAALFAAVVCTAGVFLLMLGPLAVLRRSRPGELFGGRAFGFRDINAGRIRSALVGAQVAVTAALLYVCALTVHSFAAVSSVELGFPEERVVGLQMPALIRSLTGPREERRAGVDRQRQLALETREAIRDLPGVAGAAFGPVPFAREEVVFSDEVTVRAVEGAALDFIIRLGYASSDYPTVVGLSIVKGEWPPNLRQSDEPAVIVNEAFARMLAHDGTVIGQRLKGPRRVWRITAVVSDFVSDRPDRPVAPLVLVLTDDPQAQIVVRLAEGANTDVARAAIATTFQRLWPDKASRDVVAVRTLVAAATADYRSRALVLTIIGILCLPLALAGVAGAVAFSVQQRVREIAVRIALGANHRAIQRGVLRNMALIVALGVVAGLVGGVAIGRLIGSHLFGIGAADPLSVAAASCALFIVALAGAWLPARRAATIAPAEALRIG